MNSEGMALLKSFIDRCFEANKVIVTTNLNEMALLRNIPFSYLSGYIKAGLDFGYISKSEHIELAAYIKERRDNT